MRIRLFVAAIAIAGGVILLRFSFANAGPANWTPVCLPFPGKGLAVTDLFRLESPGRFRLQVVTPVRPDGEGTQKSTDSALTGRLIVDISTPDNIELKRVITTFRFSGTAGDAVTYAGDGPIELPAAGNYEISLKTDLAVDAFRENGAMIQLVRLSPVGPEMMYPIARWTAYGLFVIALVSALGGRYARPTSTHKHPHSPAP
jgi:hypothetical protein